MNNNPVHKNMFKSLLQNVVLNNIIKNKIYINNCTSLCSNVRNYNVSSVLCTNGINTSDSNNSNLRNISKDRSTPIPVETSIRYIKSEAYQQTYGKNPVWSLYRRNHKGALPPRKTRKTCIRQNVISTGNPCPICRDEYLVLNENNPELLKQFISPNTGAILSYSVTGLCQKRHQELLIAVKRARDRGLITFDVPLRTYNYAEYYKVEN